jgi:hypothetical protein
VRLHGWILVATLSTPLACSKSRPKPAPTPGASNVTSERVASRAAPSASAEAPKAGTAKPYPITDCEVRTKNYGDWRASVELTASAVAELATGLCYNYWELDPRRAAATSETCSALVRSATVSFQVTEPEGGCGLTVRTANLGTRRWIWVQSVYARGGQVGDQIDVLELRGAALVPYARHWQCGIGWDDARKTSTPPSDRSSSELSPELRADWARLPPVLRGFLCTGELIGENLSEP